jgi:hypothetical protein
VTPPRNRTALLAVLLLLPLAFAAQAFGKPIEASTETSIDVTPLTSSTATYSGTVTAAVKREEGEKGKKAKIRRRNAEAKCKQRRNVYVWHGSTDVAKGGFLIGDTETDASGKWTLTGPLPPSGDRIFVVVTAEDPKGPVRCSEYTLGTFAP